MSTGTVLIALGLTVGLVLIYVGIRVYRAGHQSGENAKEAAKVKDYADTIQRLDASKKAADAADRLNSDPERLRDDDGHKRPD